LIRKGIENESERKVMVETVTMRGGAYSISDPSFKVATCLHRGKLLESRINFLVAHPAKLYMFVVAVGTPDA
jgi:hypothetical protein